MTINTFSFHAKMLMHIRLNANPSSTQISVRYQLWRSVSVECSRLIILLAYFNYLLAFVINKYTLQRYLRPKIFHFSESDASSAILAI